MRLSKQMHVLCTMHIITAREVEHLNALFPSFDMFDVLLPCCIVPVYAERNYCVAYTEYIRYGQFRSITAPNIMVMPPLFLATARSPTIAVTSHTIFQTSGLGMIWQIFKIGEYPHWL